MLADNSVKALAKSKKTRIGRSVDVYTLINSYLNISIIYVFPSCAKIHDEWCRQCHLAARSEGYGQDK